MSDKPLWVRWFPADFRGSSRVSEMSRDEEFLYRVLLDHQASEGSLPPDPSRLHAIAKMSRAEFLACWENVRDCFVQGEDSRWRNPRMHDERERTIAASEKLREKGRAGGLATAARRAGGTSGSTATSTAAPGLPAQPVPVEMRESGVEMRDSGCVNREQGESPPAPSRKRSSFTREVAIALLPQEHELHLGTAWRGWVEHLWQRKKPTESALQKHLAALSKIVLARGYAPAVKLLDEAVGANAQGLQGWAIENALAEPTRNGHARESAAELNERKTQEALDRVFGFDSRNPVLSRINP